MNEFGRIIRHLRLERSMTQKELSNGILSRSHLSELERGHYFCSYDKLLLILRKLNINLLEFDSLLDNSVFKEELLFQSESVQSINSHNLEKIEASYKKLNSYIDNLDSPSMRLKHLRLLYLAVFDYNKHGKINTPEKYESISVYLLSIDNWNFYELNLLNNFLFIFQPNVLTTISKKLLYKLDQDNHNNMNHKQILIKTLINISDLYLKSGDYSYSKKFSKKAYELSLKNNMLFEYSLSKINYYLANIGLYKTINPEIYEFISFLRFCEYGTLVDAIEKDIQYYVNSQD
ncbi:hypothetical protein IGI37_000530 [Enterococcus sp. AZ194]|uniref:helix-turn-helix domain-containing protein n=1 Tax=Enterococcus sp. AZ194 TaxID=2774629 RepID=UPI003F265989